MSCRDPASLQCKLEKKKERGKEKINRFSNDCDERERTKRMNKKKKIAARISGISYRMEKEKVKGPGEREKCVKKDSKKECLEKKLPT